MATDRVNDLQGLKGFIEERLSDGSDELSLDDALARWGIENESDEDRRGALDAIREGFADIEAGRLKPARTALNELREKYGLAERREELR
ncbi:hypothetical protein [Paludisphaera soli]|uniref:hypothetical protein n=1 Tax=Paludisphaera soli TaxID=2712865 RepID=UPI0013EB1842|nr:hypothetical protein [Paludisphaera soli]